MTNPKEMEAIKKALAEPKGSFAVGELIICKGHSFKVKQISHKQMKLRILEGKLK